MNTQFSSFSTEHFLTLASIGLVSLGLPLAVRSVGSTRLATGIARGLAAGLVLQEAAALWIAVGVYGRPPLPALPLHLCGVATFLAAFVLVTRSQRVFDVLYFWGLAGGMQAMLTPNLAVSFPHPLYFSFFVGHGLVIVAVCYALLVLGLGPSPRALARTALVTLPYMLGIGLFNFAFDTNFLYLRRKPEQPSLLDLMGPWPWYIPVLIAVGTLVCCAFYLPFWIRDRRRQTAVGRTR